MINTRVRTMSDFFDSQLAACRASHYESASDYTSLGVESEYLLLNEELKPVEQWVRDDIIHAAAGFCRELGAAQIETATKPFDVEKEGHWGLLEEVLQLEKVLVRQAAAYGCYVFRGGIYPGPLDEIVLTGDKLHYLDLYNCIEQSVKECTQQAVNGAPLRHKPTRYLALSQASQLNIQVGQGQKLLDVVNLSYYLAPLFLSLSANAPIVDGIRTGCMDIRNILWQIGYDSRLLQEYYENKRCGVGMPAAFYSDPDQYWEDVKTQIAYCTCHDMALGTAQRLFRKAVRLKYHEPEPGGPTYLLMESRYMSMQKDAHLDIALHLAFYTMLMLQQQKGLAYLKFPISFLQENLRNACLRGRDCHLYVLDSNQKLAKRSVGALADSMLTDIAGYWRPIARETGDFILEHITRLLSAEKQPDAQADSPKPLGEDAIKAIIYEQVLPM